METMGKPDKSLDETVKHICDVVQERIDEAYHKGWEYGKEYGSGEADMREAVSYQKGLDDAWEAAEKIVCDETLGMSTLMHIFNRGTLERIFKDIPPAEAIAKLKAYEEQKADEEVEVGDEVTDIQSGANFLVTHLWESNHGDKGVSGFNNDCSAFSATLDKVSKTGRHFDIEEILEEMKK